MTAQSEETITSTARVSQGEGLSTRSRVVIAVLVVLLVAGLIIALASIRNATSLQNAQSVVHANTAETQKYLRGTKYWDAPDMTALLGKSTWEALTLIGQGAAIRNDAAGYDATTPDGVKRVTVALAALRSQDGIEAPTVVLWVDGGRVVQAVYSSSMRSYGFSNALTFREAVENAHVVEAGLRDVGVEVEHRSLELPADEAEYLSYRDDGNTLERAYMEFTGEAGSDKARYGWIAALDYDYAEAIEKNNLAYTHRVLSVGAHIL